MARPKGWILRLAGWASAAMPASWVRCLYRLGPLTRALRSTLNKAAPTGRSTVKVSAGLLKGATFRLDLQEEKDLWLGTYEPDLQRTLRQVLGPGMTVYDVGANVGYLTIAMARQVGPAGQVHAFEPLPANFERLVDAVGLNHMQGVVNPVQAAVGAAAGTARFLVHHSGGMGKLEGSAGRQTAYEGTIDVQAVSLDEYAGQKLDRVPDWIKIDVEGGEVGVLHGAHNLLADARPGLLLELHGPAAAAGVWRLLTEVDYVMRTLKPGEGPVRTVDELDWKAYLIAEPMERKEIDG
ncbi:MAG: FkbM family methyltransferase [Anaerolineales bacterium]